MINEGNQEKPEPMAEQTAALSGLGIDKVKTLAD
jgi:hypothetical protein